MKIYMFLVVAIAVCFLPLVLHAQDKEAKTGGIQIVDAKLGTDVKDKEIVGEDTTFALNTKVWILLKVTGAANDSLTVTWKTGEFAKEITLGVGGSPWRTWSAKTAHKAGEWIVSIADSKGNGLKELKFTVK